MQDDIDDSEAAHLFVDCDFVLTKVSIINKSHLIITYPIKLYSYSNADSNTNTNNKTIYNELIGDQLNDINIKMNLIPIKLQVVKNKQSWFKLDLTNFQRIYKETKNGNDQYLLSQIPISHSVRVTHSIIKQNIQSKNQKEIGQL
eukprot:450380_1